MRTSSERRWNRVAHKLHAARRLQIQCDPFAEPGWKSIVAWILVALVSLPCAVWAIWG